MSTQNEIILYNPSDVIHLEVRLENETVWLTQAQMAELFDVKENTITYHIKDIYATEELSAGPTTRKIRVVRQEGSRSVNRNIDFYNLDMIIAVGYRVNSKNATAFRRWATDVLKKYLVDGYAVNENRLAVAQDKIKTLVQFVDLLKRTAENQIENLDPQMKELLDVAGKFATGFEVLDSYDHEELATTGATKTPAAQISVDEFLAEIKKMTAGFGGLFGLPKDDSFASSVGQIYQSFDGPTFARAHEAFYKELIDFFQKRGRQDRATAVQKQMKMIESGIVAATTKIDGIDVDEVIERAMNQVKFGETSGE